jgi:hypothetical protein
LFGFTKVKKLWQAWIAWKEIALLLFDFQHHASMITHIRKHFFTVALGIFGWLLGTGVAMGQPNSPYRQLSTAKNVPVSDTISGVNLDLNLINPLAQHGSVQLIVLATGGAGNPYVYRVRYTPDPGYVGLDTFALEYNYYGSYPYLTYRGFKVSVFPALMDARQDFATTAEGTPVTIPVLANDFSSNGGLVVTEITGSTHGTATIVGSDVQFAPNAGFTGTAHFNYTVCDATGYCKPGSATIGVHPNTALVNDTIHVFTARNTPLNYPLLYGGYSIFQAPASGTVFLAGGQSFRYTPNFNFNGNDVFTLVNNTNGTPTYTTIKVSTLNTPVQNTMAIEDYAYTPKGAPITFNVRQNDIGNLMVKGWTIPNNLPGTVSGTTSLGNVTFTPNPNFSGVATFYYKLGNSNIPDLEIGTVNVIVGNQPPSQGLFDLTTPASTPLVINYKLPFIGFDFAVLDAPDHGTCSYHSGLSTQTYGSQTVTGHNLLVYTPTPGFVGIDAFEINYCIPSNGNCQTVKIAVNVTEVLSASAPYCIGDPCVWTGDANNDGIVNNRDLLPIGFFMGQNGTVRQGAALEWFGQYGDNWNNPFFGSSFDLKYADTDGSGQVESADTTSLGLFYGQTHKLVPQVPATSKGLPFFLTFLTPPNPQVGDLVEVEVALGNESFPVTNVYGFTFDVRLSPQIVDSAFQMEYYPNTWLNSNAPYLCLDKRPRVGKLETAFTRSNGVAVSGMGTVGKFNYIIVDIIQGAKPALGQPAQPMLTFEGSTLNADGQLSPIYLGEVPMTVRPRYEGTDAPIRVRREDLRVYPSPASAQVQVHLNGNDLMENICVTDLAGKLIWRSDVNPTDHLQIDVSGFANGIYLVSARTQSGLVTRKFEVFNK